MAYRKVQQPDEDWLAAAQPYFTGRRDVLLTIRYLYNSPTMDFALPQSLDQLRLIVDQCPDGAELTLWRDIELPFRGPLTETLLEAVRAEVPDNEESLCLFITSASGEELRLKGDSWHLAKYMISELRERMGECVAIGSWPNGTETLRAVKGGIEGPR